MPLTAFEEIREQIGSSQQSLKYVLIGVAAVLFAIFAGAFGGRRGRG